MSNQRYLENYWREQELKKLLRGMSATFENNMLAVFKDGDPYENFTIGATQDWMSGNFTINGQSAYKWDSGRRKRRNPKCDCWAYHGQNICDMINRFGG